MEEEIAKHQVTRTKLQNAEKEIRELRKLYEKLASKHRKISHLFNEVKTLVDEDPPVSIPKYLRMAHLPGVDDQPLPDTNTPGASPSVPHKATDSTASTPAASPVLSPAASPPTATPTPAEPTSTEQTSPTIAPVVVTTPPATTPTPPSEETSPPTSPPPATPTLVAQLSNSSLSNSTGSLPLMTSSSGSDLPGQQRGDKQSASPRPGRSYLTRLFSSGSSKDKNKDEQQQQVIPRLKSQDSWIYDRRDHIINQFLKAEKSYCSNLNVIVEVPCISFSLSCPLPSLPSPPHSHSAVVFATTEARGLVIQQSFHYSF